MELIPREVVAINSVAYKCHENAKEHGWWDDERPVPELLCLVHSEVSEALEDYRNGTMDHFGEELADIVIRVFDMAAALNIDIGKEINDKHITNISRPYRHGNKKC